MLYKISAILILAATYVTAEQHIVSFDNRCGRGAPTLVSKDGNVLSTGATYVSNGPLIGAIAYLQTGNCGLGGDRCTVVETTLQNPTCDGCGSNTGISLVTPHAFSVTTGFDYQNGCDGAGANCNGANCGNNQVACKANDVNLVVTFCA